MPNTLDQMLQRCYAESHDPTPPPPRLWQGLCQMFARTVWGVPPRDGSAALAWSRATFRHFSGTPPLGAFIYWTGGGDGNGHVAVSTGNGNCWSTDILRRGYPDHVAIALIDSEWGNLDRVGWTEDTNGVRVITVGSGEGGGEPIPPPPEVPAPPTSEEDEMQQTLPPGGRALFPLPVGAKGWKLTAFCDFDDVVLRVVETTGEGNWTMPTEFQPYSYAVPAEPPGGPKVFVTIRKGEHAEATLRDGCEGVSVINNGEVPIGIRVAPAA